MSRSIFGWDLPPGCSSKDIEDAMGGNIDEEECENCSGLGHLGSECCGVEVKQGLCSKCHEHAEEDSCPICKGEGFIVVDKPTKEELHAEAAERRADELREEM